MHDPTLKRVVHIKDIYRHKHVNICNIGNRRTIILYHQFKGQGIGKLNLILFLVWYRCFRILFKEIL